MEENKEEVTNQEPVTEEVIGNTEPVAEEPQESIEELKARLENAKAENARKSQLIQQLKEEQSHVSVEPTREQKFNPQDLTTWKDHELKAVINDPQYAALKDQAQDLLDRRRFQRWQRDEQDKNMRVTTELERSKRFPETLNPSSPISVKMSEIMVEYKLDNTPAGRLAAAEIAHSRLLVEKAKAAGRKTEQSRQADVTASFSGGASRPAPKPSESAKMEELKKRAMSGDPQARAEWFKIRGII